MKLEIQLLAAVVGRTWVSQPSEGGLQQGAEGTCAAGVPLGWALACLGACELIPLRQWKRSVSACRRDKSLYSLGTAHLAPASAGGS